MSIAAFFQTHRRWAVVAAVCAVAAIASAMVWALAGKNRAVTSPELSTPLLAIRTIAPRTLFFSPAARSALVALRPETLTPEDKDEKSERLREYAIAVQNPTFWRQMDRRYRFDTVLLTGEPNEYRPLLRHLLESRDWVLAYLDHTSIVFQLAPARAWTEHDIAAVREKFANRPKEEQVEFLVQAANRLLSVGQTALSKKYLDEALALDDRSVTGWTQLAAYDGTIGQWPDALSAVDKALRIEPEFGPALAMKAQALLATNRANEAYSISQRLVEQNPKDPFLLFQHAKIAHTAHAYASEAEALKTLIAIAEAAHQSTCGYHIYLAQAYAAQGDAEPSLGEFHKALEDPAITPEQREYVQDSIERLNSKTGR